jgi:hypothetical protein
MGLMIWLGLILKLRHWTIHPTHLPAFVYLFGSIGGCPYGSKMEKNSINTFFLVVLDHFY